MERRRESRSDTSEQELSEVRKHLQFLIQSLEISEYLTKQESQELDQLRHRLDSTQRLADLEIGFEHLTELLQRFENHSHHPKKFQALIKDFDNTKRAIQERLAAQQK